MTSEDDIKKMELGIKAQELAIKKAEEQNKAWDLYNQFSRETRARADGLVRAVLLVSGGALTLSIGAFLKQDTPYLSPACVNLLHWSWVLLIASMVLAVFTVFVGVLSSDLHGKRWLSWLNNGRLGELKQPRASGYIQWFIGIIALVTHWLGLGLLAFIAIQVIS